MEKKVASSFVKISCIDNVGSCPYGNICKDWAEACPKYSETYGLSYNCPFPVNIYLVSGVIVDVTETLPWGWGSTS